MLRIDAAQQLAFVVAERDRVISLARSRRPRGSLPRQDNGEAIEVGDEAAIDRRIQREQACLVREELPDGNALLASLCELGPVGADPLVIVDPPAGVREGQRHGGESLGGRVDDHHGVALPRLGRLPVANAAPEIDDLLTPAVGAARAAELPATRKVVDKCVPHSLESGADVAVDVRCRCRHDSLRRRRPSPRG
jgi:hypothetical protein